MKTAARVFPVIAALSSLLSCVPSQQSDISLYKELIESGEKRPGVPDAGAPLTLVGAMTLANTHHETLGIEGENYVQALVRRRRAVAAFLPTVSLVPSYFLRDESGGTPDRELDEQGQPLGGGSVNEGKDLSLEGRLSLSPLQNAASALAAGANATSRRAVLLDVQDRLLFDVARGYYEAVRAEKQAEVLRSTIELQDARLADVTARNEVGIASVLDVNLSLSQNARTRAELILAETRVKTNRLLLEFLTAWPDARTTVLADTFELPVTASDVDEQVNQAVANRFDLQAATANIDAAAHRVTAAYAGYAPSLSLNLSYFLSRESEPTERMWSSLLELSLPLFSAGIVEADLRLALSELRQAKLTFAHSRRRIEREVRSAWENWRGAERRFVQAEVLLESAIRASEAADAMYESGTATSLERLTAANELQQSRLQVTDARSDRILAYLDLRRVTGTIHSVAGLERETASGEKGGKERA